MVCPSCNKHLDEKMFFVSRLKGINICDKCIYNEKLKKIGKKKKLCPVCNEIVPKGRTKFCSSQCYEENSEIMIRQYYCNNKENSDNSWRKTKSSFKFNKK